MENLRDQWNILRELITCMRLNTCIPSFLSYDSLNYSNLRAKWSKKRHSITKIRIIRKWSMSVRRRVQLFVGAAAPAVRMEHFTRTLHDHPLICGWHVIFRILHKNTNRTGVSDLGDWWDHCISLQGIYIENFKEYFVSYMVFSHCS
jgi:hypothetical protein